MYGYIYITTNMINGKRYIGKRQKQEFDVLYKGSGVHLKNAFIVYGKENFETHLIKECVDKNDLDSSEQYFIKLYDAVNSKDFYNIAHGGDGGNTGRQYKGQPANHIQSEEEKLKRSESLKRAYAENRHPIIKAGWKKGQRRTEHDVIANRERNLGKIWVCKTDCQTTVSAEELEKYLSDGWVRGRLKNKKPAWNKGLTKDTSLPMKKLSEIRKESLKHHSIGFCKSK